MEQRVIVGNGMANSNGVRRIENMANKEDKEDKDDKVNTEAKQCSEVTVTYTCSPVFEEKLEKKLELLFDRINLIEDRLRKDSTVSNNESLTTDKSPGDNKTPQVKSSKGIKLFNNTLSKVNVDSIRNYAHIGRIAGQVLETLSVCIITIIDSLNEEKGSLKTPVGEVEAPGKVFDLSGVLGTVTNLIQGVARMNDGGEDAADNRSD